MLIANVDGTYRVWAKEDEMIWRRGGRDSIVRGGSFLFPWGQNVNSILPNDLHRLKEILNVESRGKDEEVQLLTRPIGDPNLIPRDLLNFIPDDLDMR